MLRFSFKLSALGCDFSCQSVNIFPVSLLLRTVENASEFLHLVNKGLQLRVTHPTLVHAHSSRSHLVVTLTITTVVFGDNFGK